MRFGQKPCNQCGEKISVSATKCSKCQGFQNWRRHFELSSVMIAMLVALVSVTSLALPIIYPYFYPPFSNIEIGNAQLETPPGAIFEPDIITLTATNMGERPGHIRSIIFLFHSDQTSYYFSPVNQNRTLLDPGSKQLSFEPAFHMTAKRAEQILKQIDKPPPGRSKPVSFFAKVTEYDGSLNYHKLRLTPIDARRIFSNHRLTCSIQTDRGKYPRCFTSAVDELSLPKLNYAFHSLMISDSELEASR